MKAFLFLCLSAWLVDSAAAAQASTYVGSDSCKGCHEAAWSGWRRSGHFKAMLPASPETVLGDFDDATFEYAGLTHRFYRRDGRFFVETDNASGELQEFEIDYTFGYYPLQQYLVGFPDGRYQALNIVWDTRPAASGGQRWYHLYPDDAITHDDILHWTGSFQNWNSRCAACHSTDLKKNYSLATNSYETRWAEVNVGCEACHGPGSTHRDWAAGDRERPDPGFSNHLAGKGSWTADGEQPTLRRQDGGTASAQTGTCAACHSRRTELSEDHAGKPFQDLFQLRLLEGDMYYPDGQIREEVYEYGSFLQSRMAQAGVACSNCHEPHSNQLLAEGNALCGQCHEAAVFDQASHHHHAEGSEGAACVNCHMPATTYMGVDARRDHSFRVPEPQLTVDLGIPNACNRCHGDKDAAWAAGATREWNPGSTIRAAHARVLAAAQRGQSEALPGLIALANDASRSGILRATAVLESARFPSRESLALVQRQLGDPDPLVRGAAARSLQGMPAADRFGMLAALISDPAKSVRMEVAPLLADLSAGAVSANDRDALNSLRNEYLEALGLNADMPESMLNLGSYLAMSGQPEEAERAYRHALKLSPAFVPVMINLADLYRMAGMDSAASPLLQSAIALEPDMASSHHAMGLLLVRQGQMERAVDSLRKAAELDPDNVRFTYVLAIALYEQGQPEQALALLEQAMKTHPGDPDVIAALRAYYQQLGLTEKLQALEASQAR